MPDPDATNNRDDRDTHEEESGGTDGDNDTNRDGSQTTDIPDPGRSVELPEFGEPPFTNDPDIDPLVASYHDILDAPNHRTITFENLRNTELLILHSALIEHAESSAHKFETTDNPHTQIAVDLHRRTVAQAPRFESRIEDAQTSRAAESARERAKAAMSGDGRASPRTSTSTNRIRRAIEWIGERVLSARVIQVVLASFIALNLGNILSAIESASALLVYTGLASVVLLTFLLGYMVRQFGLGGRFEGGRFERGRERSARIDLSGGER
jgi:hypothetical protein